MPADRARGDEVAGVGARLSLGLVSGGSASTEARCPASSTTTVAGTGSGMRHLRQGRIVGVDRDEARRLDVDPRHAVGPGSDARTVTGPVRSVVDAPRLAGASRRRSISAASIPRPPSESPLVGHSLGIDADLVTAVGTGYCGDGPDAAEGRSRPTGDDDG